MENVWRNWDQNALDDAHREAKPLLLWITYRGCQACARMEEESFSDATIAGKIREDFVAIRVDRDEYPDIDRHFQRVFSVMLGKEEGWPLTLFLTPEGAPLYAAAYVPPQSQDGMMGMETLLDLVAKKYAEDPAGFADKGIQALEQLKPPLQIEATRIDPDVLVMTLSQQLQEVYDPRFGGYGQGPRRLHPSVYELILSLQATPHGPELTRSLYHTLDTMLRSPIWDGSFYEGSMDEEWQVPVRRKSLTANARMLSVLIGAARSADDPDKYQDAARAIGRWCVETMQDTKSGLRRHGWIDGTMDGRFFAASNARAVQALFELSRLDAHFRPDAQAWLDRLMETMAGPRGITHGLRCDHSTQYLIDYAAISGASLAAYDATGTRAYLDTAADFASAALQKFYDRGRWHVAEGSWDDPVDFRDISGVSPAAEMAHVLYRLSQLFDKGYLPFVTRTLEVASYDLMRNPLNHARLSQMAMEVF